MADGEGLISLCPIPLAKSHFVGPVLFHLFAAGRTPVSGVLIRPPQTKIKHPQGVFNFCGGWWGIRTPGGVAPTTVFKTAAFDRSANHPKLPKYTSVFQPTVLVFRITSLCLHSTSLALRSQDTHASSHSANHPKLLHHWVWNHAQFIFWQDKCQMFFILIFDFYFHVCSLYTSTPISYPFFYASKSIVIPFVSLDCHLQV